VHGSAYVFFFGSFGAVVQRSVPLGIVSAFVSLCRAVLDIFGRNFAVRGGRILARIGHGALRFMVPM